MKNILIIEDDEFLRGLIAKKLSDDGFGVSLAVSGKDGLEKIKKDKPDLIILDLLLPIMDGFEVLEDMKKDASIRMIPVVILSNLGQPEEIAKGIKLGANDYLVKAQMTTEEIAKKIKNYIK